MHDKGAKPAKRTNWEKLVGPNERRSLLFDLNDMLCYI